MAPTQGWSFVLDEPTRILVADDDPIFCEFASVHLSTPVATVEAVQDGEAAWQHLADGEFDLALLDIEMPGLDGFELLSRVRADDRLKHLPCVMVTGREDIASIDRAYELGSTSFVTKPVNWRQLSYQLRHVLRIERELREARDRAESRASALPASEAESLRESIGRILDLAARLERDSEVQAERITEEGREALRLLARCMRERYEADSSPAAGSVAAAEG